MRDRDRAQAHSDAMAKLVEALLATCGPTGSAASGSCSPFAGGAHRPGPRAGFAPARGPVRGLEQDSRGPVPRRRASLERPELPHRSHAEGGKQGHGCRAPDGVQRLDRSQEQPGRQAPSPGIRDRVPGLRHEDGPVFQRAAAAGPVGPVRAEGEAARLFSSSSAPATASASATRSCSRRPSAGRAPSRSRPGPGTPRYTRTEPATSPTNASTRPTGSRSCSTRSISASCRA